MAGLYRAPLTRCVSLRERRRFAAVVRSTVRRVRARKRLRFIRKNRYVTVVALIPSVFPWLIRFGDVWAAP